MNEIGRNEIHSYHCGVARVSRARRPEPTGQPPARARTGWRVASEFPAFRGNERRFRHRPHAVEESVSGLDRMPAQAADGFGVDEPDSIRSRHQLRCCCNIRLI
jgi:hypothetical protein